MKTINYMPKGVCSSLIKIEINDNDIIESVVFTGGCQGNLAGIGRLLEGMPVNTAIEKLKNIKCGRKSTSCPDQLAIALTNDKI